MFLLCSLMTCVTPQPCATWLLTGVTPSPWDCGARGHSCTEPLASVRFQ